MGEHVRLVVDAVAPRLDIWLAGRGEVDLSRSQVQRLIGQGAVAVDGRVVTQPSVALHGGERIEIDLPEPEPARALPEDIPLDIVYEDDDLLVINKARGMVVHPAPGNRRGTLVNAILHHCGDHLPTVGGAFRPGIVHRLDKDTTGLLLVAKTDAAYVSLQRQIAARQVKRVYLALVHGVPPERFDVDAPIGRDPRDRKRMAVIPPGSGARARYALTHVQRIEESALHSLLRVRLSTGRTHQIRVHLAHAGYPVVGDQVYGRPTLDRKQNIRLLGQALHAQSICLRHPLTGVEMGLSTPLPNDFASALHRLIGDAGS